MAMIINNSAAMMTLGELNKNISRAGKDLKKIASGERITGAGDDASGYSISERMRVRIRALGQNEVNVQNGQALLHVAEGAIQSQIELMKTIKQKVIDADNDTNTDIDRQTIQKEINHSYQEIEDIAQETNYNGVRLLVGDKVEEKVLSWVVKSNSSLLEGSDAMNMINVIPDTYPTLNGITGPFDLFTPSKITGTQLASLGFTPTIQCEGGTGNVFTIDSSFSTVDSLNGCTFSINGAGYVLTMTPSNNNEYGGTISDDTITLPTGTVTEIDISGCNSVEDVMDCIDAKISAVTGHGENYLICSKNITSGSESPGYNATIEAVPGTGLFSGTVKFSGGKDAEGVSDDDPDSADHKDPETASFYLENLTANTGITIHEGIISDVRLHYLRFVEGDSAPVSSVPSNGVLTVGVDYSGTFDIQSIPITMENKTIKIMARESGTYGNAAYSVEDGIAAKTYNYLSTSKLSGTNSSQNAYATVDVSGYSNVEDLINDLTGKAIAIGMSTSSAKTALYENGFADAWDYGYLEFIDSAADAPLDRMYKIESQWYGKNVLDLNDLRRQVADGKTIGKAFSDFVTGINVPQVGKRIETATNSSGETIGIKVRAAGSNTAGNAEKIFLVQGSLRSYTLDYGKWFNENTDVSIPDFLNNKGFRAYCASCDNQVFNFHLITEDLPDTPRPESDPDGEDIKHIYIDVSNVTDASSLVQAIYDQAMPELTSDDEDLNHFMRLIADDDKLIIYDERRFVDDYLRYATKDKSGNLLYEYQWDDTYNVGGAKIADGVWDNVEVGERKIYVKDLVIQDTDHASQNIHLKIPQTTMDHLFGYEAGSREWSEFNVMTSKSREALLGNQAGKTRSGKTIATEEEGLLDHALNYLIGANCLVGAQMMRLKMTEANIVTQRESTTASESTVRDADMAKEMTAYTKANVLAQAAQSMLAQANQNGAGVLKLLQ